jgi:hypothetical protein
MVAWQHEKEMGIIWPPHQPTSYMASLYLSCGLSLMWPIIPLLCGLFLPNLMRLLQISLSCGLYILLSSCGLCFHLPLMPPHSSLTLSCGLIWRLVAAAPFQLFLSLSCRHAASIPSCFTLLCGLAITPSLHSLVARLPVPPSHLRP